MRMLQPIWIDNTQNMGKQHTCIIFVQLYSKNTLDRLSKNWEEEEEEEKEQH